MGTSNTECGRRRLAILVVTPDISTEGGPVTIGRATPSLSQPAFVPYAELLSGANHCFDLVRPDHVTRDTFVCGDTIQYAVVIMTCPLSLLGDSGLAAVGEAAHRLGVSLIGTFAGSDEPGRAFFGIRRFRKAKLLWPLKVRIDGWPAGFNQKPAIARYGPTAGVAGLRKRGLRKLSLGPALTKMVGRLRGSAVPFARVDLEEDRTTLATTMQDEPIAWSYRFGRATNYYFALHRDILLGRFNEMHRLVRSAIEANSGFGMVGADVGGALALRLDDPGACSSDHLGTSGVLVDEDWEKMGALLGHQQMPLSVMYTPQWVDDGDAHAGKLLVNGQQIRERKPGKSYDSPSVQYVRLQDPRATYDHGSEYKGIHALMDSGIAEVHSHGLTHLDPDHEAWAKDANRNKDERWYHEFFHAQSGRRVSPNGQLDAMMQSKRKIEGLFGAPVCVLTPSGHRHGPESDLLARNAGYLMFSADYTGILKPDVVIRNWKIPSVFLYLKDPTPFASRSGYPFIGVVHDYEIKSDLGKLGDVIEKWRASGVSRFISMRELAVSLGSSIVGYYVGSESRLELVFALGDDAPGCGEAADLAGIRVRLRIFLPENIEEVAEACTATGATVFSLERLGHDNAVVVSLGLGESRTVTVSLALRACTPSKAYG